MEWRKRSFLAVPYGPYYIWGATARILYNFSKFSQVRDIYEKVNVEKVFGSELKELMRLLSSSGKECYIVGGAVRDLLLGYKNLKILT